MKGWFLEQLTGSICLIEFVKILCEKSPNYADQANSSQMEQIEMTFWLSLHLLWGGAEMDSIRSQLIKLVLFLREAEVRKRPPFRDISLIMGAEVSRSSGLFPVNGKRRLRCQWNQVIFVGFPDKLKQEIAPMFFSRFLWLIRSFHVRQF